MIRLVPLMAQIDQGRQMNRRQSNVSIIGLMLFLMTATGCAILTPEYPIAEKADKVHSERTNFLGWNVPTPIKNKTIAKSDKIFEHQCRMEWYKANSGSPSQLTLATLGVGAATGDAIGTTTPLVGIVGFILFKRHWEWRNDRERFIDSCIAVKRADKAEEDAKKAGEAKGNSE